MKAKYFGTIAQGMALASAFTIFGVAAWLFTGSKKIAGADAAVKGMAVIPDTSPAHLEAIKRLYPRLSELARPTKRSSGEISFVMLGFSQDSLASHTSQVLASTENFTRHAVTMAYVSAKERYAVIDGALYREGEMLGDSGTVRTITPEKVLIAGREVRQWIEVNNPNKADAAPPPQAQQAAKSTEIAAPAPDKTESASDEAKGTAAQAVEALKGFSNLLDQLKTVQGRAKGENQ